MRGSGAYSSIYGQWERGRFYELDLLQHWLSLPAPHLYIDVGAHAGNHTVWAGLAWPQTRILAFEPHPEAFELLIGNAAANLPPVAARVRCVNAAAWSDGRYALYLRSIGDDEGMRQVEWQWEVAQGPFVQVEAQAIDDLVDEDNRDILIKVDTEDRVWHPLFGAKEVLRRNRCRLYVEAASDRAMRDLHALCQLAGYRLTGKVFGSTPVYEAVRWNAP
jgi:FkbM family methyltransferase